MDYRVQFPCFIGIILFTFIDVTTSTDTRSSRQTDKLVLPKAAHHAIRLTRDAENSSISGDTQNDGPDLMSFSILLLDNENLTTKPGWYSDMTEQKWYGVELYFNRSLYRRDPTKRPTVCYNNLTKVENGTRPLLYFICPMEHQGDSYVYCCGAPGNQSCCTKAMHDKDATNGTSEQDLDLITGLSLAAGFAAGFTICMLLYCCCCQRRPEIHDGIKLIWVRRSFGKELSRLEQPTYPNHLAVVSSRAASRSGSRSGSRFGSHQGSRNPSRGPSPSVSRRASHDRSPSRKHKVAATTNDHQKLAADVPTSVVITVTTPSDDQGPSNPLLQSTD